MSVVLEDEPNATELGDWYVNRIVVDRQPLLVLISSKSLLPIVAPAREVRTLPGRLAEMVRARLDRLGVEAPFIDAEVRTLDPVHVAPTNDRSVLGALTEFCRMLPYHLPKRGWNEFHLLEAERKLADMPCFVTRRVEATIWPAGKAVELLQDRWSIGPDDGGVHESPR